MSRDRIVVSLVIVAGVMGAFWFGALTPKRQEVQRLEAKLATQQQRLSTAQKSAANATTARDRYNADYGALTLLGKAVPATEGMASLLYQLDRAAGDAKVDFRSIANGGGAAGAQPAGPQPSGAASATPPSGAASATSPSDAASATPATLAPTPLALSMTFTGSYMDMQRLLARVNGFVRVEGDAVRVTGRLLSIDDIALATAEGSRARVQATISATAYTLPESAPVTGPASAAQGAAGAAAGSTPAMSATSGSTQ